MKKITAFLKKEIVLSVAWVLAVVSAFFVTPDKVYLDYIDFRTLALLFCLMSVMAGLTKLQVFQYIAEVLLNKVKSSGQLVIILTMLCFFFSMFITNDVALIVFVPFTFTVLKLLGDNMWQKLLIPVVVMQTIAANLGSMMTPIGNPQNMYLFNLGNYELMDFSLLMLPYTVLAFIILVVWGIVSGKKAKEKIQVSFENRTSLSKKGLKLSIYMVLFILCLLVVAHKLEYYWVFAIVFVVVAIMDTKVLFRVDYTLLLTFVGFFIFTGNIGRIPAIGNLLQSLVNGQPMLTTLVACQGMSNVPAALLLSGFCQDLNTLIVGVNLGGLGTLIASMASLISYKYVAREDGERKGQYFKFFTVANICFLIALVALYCMKTMIFG